MDTRRADRRVDRVFQVRALNAMKLRHAIPQAPDCRMTRSGGVMVAVIALGLGACASSPPAPVVDLSDSNDDSAPHNTDSQVPPAATQGTYRVVRGDTLYAIAFRHGLDFRDVAAWNKIVPPYRIYAGQDIRLDAPAGTTRPPTPAAAPGAPPSVAPSPTTATTAGATSAPGPAPSKPGMFEDVPPPAATMPKPPSGSVPNADNPAPSTPVVQAKPAAPELPAKPAASEVPAKPSATEPSPAPRIADDSVVTSTNGVTWRWPGKGSLVGTFVAGDQTRQGIDVAGKAGDPVLAAANGEVVYSGNGLLGYGELIIVKHNANFLSAYGHNRKRLVQEGEKVKAGQQIAEMGSSASSREELHFEIRKNGKPVNPLDYLPAR
jgi:lipoprotein NlpD